MDTYMDMNVQYAGADGPAAAALVEETLEPSGGEGLSPDETRLVAALRAGDEAAFITLLDRHQGAMVRLAQVYVGDRSVAEDVTQEAWEGVLHGLERFEGRASLKTWIFRILVNRARTRAEREGRSVPFSVLSAAE